MTSPIALLERSRYNFIRRMDDCCKERFGKRLEQAIQDSEKLLPDMNVRAASVELRHKFKELRQHELSLLSSLERNKGIEYRQRCDEVHSAAEVQFCDHLCQCFALPKGIECQLLTLSDRRLVEASVFRRKIRLAYDTSGFIVADIRAGNANKQQTALSHALAYLDTVFTDELHVES